MFHPGMLLSDHLAQCVHAEWLAQAGPGVGQAPLPAEQPKRRWPALALAGAAVAILLLWLA